MQKRYRLLGKTTIKTEDTQNELSENWVGDAHTVDEDLRGQNGPLQVILDSILKGYTEFEITVRGRK